MPPQAHLTLAAIETLKLALQHLYACLHILQFQVIIVPVRTHVRLFCLAASTSMPIIELLAICWRLQLLLV